jgi:hypothetical protein
MDSIAVSDSLAAIPHPHPQLDVTASLVELELTVDNLIAIPRTQLDIQVINQLTIILDHIEPLIKIILAIFHSLSGPQMSIVMSKISLMSCPLTLMQGELTRVYDTGYPAYINSPTMFERDISDFLNPERNGAINPKISEMFQSIPINEVRAEYAHLYNFFPKPIPAHAGNFVKDLVMGGNDLMDEVLAKKEYETRELMKALVFEKFNSYTYKKHKIISERYKARHPTVGPLKALIDKFEEINLEVDCFLSANRASFY